jgi:NAD(P)-dependent dehydrogenase (short-subunit alcohol dehydrogenase family)
MGVGRAKQPLRLHVAHLGIEVTIVEPGPLRTQFATGAITRSPHNDDYQESVGSALDWFDGLAGRQPNDPHRVAAIVEAVGSPNPPLRLTLGEEAAQAIHDKLERQRQDLDTWQRLSASTAVS